MLNDFSEDLDVYAYRIGLQKSVATKLLMILMFPTTWPIGVYRFGRWSRKFRSRFIRKTLFIPYFFSKRVAEILTGIEIAYTAEIGPGIVFTHIGGVVIGPYSRIGKYASFHEGVTVGAAGSGIGNYGFPEIGDAVYFGAGSKVIGRVKLGNDVLIGANAVVTNDFPDKAVVAGVPARLLRLQDQNPLVHWIRKPPDTQPFKIDVIF